MQQPNPHDQPAACLSVPRLATFLGVSRATVCRALAAGQLKHHRFRGRVLFTPADVQAILAATEWKARRGVAA
ncbi:MAG: helix-turn-helix domain-containing protein [Thermoanaerobaculia bacterium]